jgi:hypothetical protein
MPVRPVSSRFRALDYYMNYYMRKAEVLVVGWARAPACSPPSPIRRRARGIPVRQQRRLELVPTKAWGLGSHKRF